MNFVIYTAACTGKAANCDYPNRVEVTGPGVLKEAVKFDHVCARICGQARPTADEVPHDELRGA